VHAAQELRANSTVALIGEFKINVENRNAERAGRDGGQQVKKRHNLKKCAMVPVPKYWSQMQRQISPDTDD